MAELKLLAAEEPRNAIVDGLLRIAAGLVFVVFGTEKFGTQWVGFFQQVGLGQWFRYFTGVVEILGGLLVCIPRTAMIGLALLGSAMAGAMLILAFVLGRPGDSVFPGAFLLGLAALAWNRRRQ